MERSQLDKPTIHNYLGYDSGWYKWMWHPQYNIVIICSPAMDHRLAWLAYSKKNNSKTEFADWVRFLNVTSNGKELLCVRVFGNSKYTKDHVIELTKTMDIKTELYFDVTNEILEKLTGISRRLF